MDTDRVDVRREPLVVRDGCAPGRTPLGRWPSDEVLFRSEQFAVNEAVAHLTDHRADGPGHADAESQDWVFGMHAPEGTGTAEVFGDLVAAIVTERARRIADLANPAEAFGTAHSWGAHTVTEPAAGLAGFEIVLTAPEAGDGPARPGPGLPPIGASWRDRAVSADYFASTARLADGVGAWAMLAARLGDRSANRAFAERWWHGAVRGADVLFPAGESMAVALHGLKGTTVYWQACVTWFRSTLTRVQSMAAERAEAAAALSRLSLFEQACEDAALSVQTARRRLADLMAREPAARDAAGLAEEAYQATLAALGAHELCRPRLASLTTREAAALGSTDGLPTLLTEGIRRGWSQRNWAIARRELRGACMAAEQTWAEALQAAETLRDEVTATRAMVEERVAAMSRLTTELEPFAAAVAGARERWGDCVPVGPSQSETDDPALIEWRETSSPWADAEYARARAEAFIAALELHKALIVTQADVFEANLAALMELITTNPAPGDSGLTEARRAAWRSFFLVVPVVQVPFEAAGRLFCDLAPGTLGWLIAAGADRLAIEDLSGLLPWFDRAVFAGDEAPGQATVQGFANRMVRYGTWLAARTPSGPDEAEPRWVGLPLRVVRGQDRTTVERRNDLARDALLISDRG